MPNHPKSPVTKNQPTQSGTNTNNGGNSEGNGQSNSEESNG